ncbi:transglutaminase domain-containing protein [Pseudodesulfovibrio mercurii]|uniref:Transglutaminase domain-containing protein n=1 Tax=Pseudodesulfovibrio mercurii TaxID=641491 RepID=F0JK79_9BACT|nr:transglutaminase family protein [Pseudodesulfovibrio mercurii]EGB16328.1 transglutaminase domain-containing protein [Pseudodesulfovibrio mercurii]
MRFTLRHLTRYAYSRPVFLEPHTFRLTPRQDACQRVLAHELRINPAPAGRFEGTDAEGNPFVQAWFDGLTETLTVEALTTAETLRANPFGFLLDDAACRVPPAFAPAEERALAPCLRTDAADDAVAALTGSLLDRSDGRGLDFLLELNAWIFGNVAKVIRREPGILAPATVCRERRGACRDSAVLFIACCRRAGIPARFVSGYQSGDDAQDKRDLHAWAEAYLPGAGWLGLDPTHGLLTADRHLALAASHDPAQTAPAQGAFRGTDATATLTHTLTLTVE